MSDLTPCNYCNLERIRRTAAKAGGVVIIKPGKPLSKKPNGYQNAKEVFIQYPGNKKPTKVSWMAEIPNKCVC